MADGAKTIDVELLGRTYRVACNDGEREALMQAVAYLDGKMNDIKAAGKVAGPVLLVGPTGAINASTAAELTRLQPKKIIVLGGTGSVSDAVLDALAAFL